MRRVSSSRWGTRAHSVCDMALMAGGVVSEYRSRTACHGRHLTTLTGASQLPGVTVQPHCMPRHRIQYHMNRDQIECWCKGMEEVEDAGHGDNIGF